jgi:hypothetical protein
VKPNGTFDLASKATVSLGIDFDQTEMDDDGRLIVETPALEATCLRLPCRLRRRLKRYV